MRTRLRSPGLRARLATAIVLIVAVALGIAFFALYRGTESELRNRTEDQLRAKVEQVSRVLERGEAGSLTREARAVVANEPVGPESIIVAISVKDEGRFTNQPDLLIDEEAKEPGEEGDRKGEEGDEKGDERESSEHTDRKRELDDDLERFWESPEGFSEGEVAELDDVLVLTSTAETGQRDQAVVRAAESLRSTEEALEGLRGTFLWVGLVALVTTAALALLMASRLTRPLRRLTELSGRVGDEEDLSARMPLGEAGQAETLVLAESFNRMLDRLEEAFAKQKAFVADASHDLRTPLTVVRGQLEVLARDPDPSPEEVRRVQGVVSEATARMERLVGDLLLLAKSDSGVSLRMESLAVAPLIEAEIEVRPEEQARRIELGELSEREVRMDRDAVSRALANLVDNALRHSGENGSVVLSAVDHPTGVEIRVEDDGPGIPPDQRERVFDRFARLDQSRSSDSGGSGLGLAIVKVLVESQGGRVLCEQSPLGGARFVIRLPAPPTSGGTSGPLP